MSRFCIRTLCILSLAAGFGWLSIVPVAQIAQGADGAGRVAGRLNPVRSPGSSVFPRPLPGVSEPARVSVQGGPIAGPGFPQSAVLGARRGAVTNSSPGYAGYLIQPTTASPVAVSFVVPTLSCPSNRDLAVIPGVIAGGTSYLGAGIALQCSSGQASYQAVAFYNGPFYGLETVTPGDTVYVSVSDASSSSSSVATVEDATTGVIQSVSFPSFPMSYADLGNDYEYNYYTPLGMPPFGSIAFTGAYVGGKTLGSLSPAGYNMGNGITTLIQTSAITSAGTGFTTTFRRSLFPTTVQGRVIEGVAGQQTLSATVWPVTFTSTASSNPSSFTATIYWGDGTAATTGSISSVPAWNCTYSPLTPVGTCFAVTGRHLYSASGDYPVTVAVQGPGGGASASGIAEIVNPTATTATNSVGVLTWSSTNTHTPVNMCTATALAGLDVVVTAKHCFDTNLSQDSNFQFAPQHSGNCGSGNNIMSISACEAAGKGTDPFGYWTGTGAVYPASDTSATNAGHDTTLVALGDISSTGYSLTGDIGGLPMHFDPPHGQLKFSTYGYPGRAGNWSLQKCLGAPDVSVATDSVIGITPCSFGNANGASGSPFVSSHFLPNAISATLIGFCPPNSYCPTLQWLHPQSGYTAVGNLMSNNSMQVYLVAVLGVPQP
jgi:hypothetical protein